MKRSFDVVVFIGRFQPFHLGHKAVIQQALTLADEVIVCVGSSGKPRSTKNPWSFDERSVMITDGLDLVAKTMDVCFFVRCMTRHTTTRSGQRRCKASLINTLSV